MADQTDEEKVKAAFPDVENSKEEDETQGKPEDSTEEDESKPDVTGTSTEDTKSKEEEEETPPTGTLTKPFPWLKGDTPEEWDKELATAYENSTNEALRLKKERDEAVALIDEAKKVIANGVAQPPDTQGQPADGTQQPANPLASQVPAELQYAKTLMDNDLAKSFGEFAKQYPQARDPDGFKQIEQISQAAATTFAALHNRQPTYAELFDQAANILRWDPVDKSSGKKDQAIKESASSGSTPQSTNSRPPVKGPKISEAQLEVARRFFPGKTDEDILKDLPNYVT